MSVPWGWGWSPAPRTLACIVGTQYIICLFFFFSPWYIYICISLLIFIYRERESERERATDLSIYLSISPRLEYGWRFLKMFLCCCSGLTRLSSGLLTSTASCRTIGLVCLWIFIWRTSTKIRNRPRVVSSSRNTHGFETKVDNYCAETCFEFCLSQNLWELEHNV